jgi:hypothetical protein
MPMRNIVRVVQLDVLKEEEVAMNILRARER